MLTLSLRQVLSLRLQANYDYDNMHSQQKSIKGITNGGTINTGIKCIRFSGNFPNGVPKFQYVFYASPHTSVRMLRQCLSISTRIIMLADRKGALI